MLGSFLLPKLQPRRLLYRRSHSASALFSKVLVANRGEIAIRVMKTCRRLGIPTVAVYSEADARSLHVRYADEAVCIGPGPSTESYLRMDRILAAAHRTGAQAIHPGYGFLSENPSFADTVESAGLVFIGPSSSAMLAMGDKINSKIIAQSAGCFVIPGFNGEIANLEEAKTVVQDIGYPVMIKASAGGGGKGMRVAHNDAQLTELFQLCKDEAQSSFGDSRLLIERFIEEPHHIEIQVLADSHGNVIAFPEREVGGIPHESLSVVISLSALFNVATRRSSRSRPLVC